MPQKKCRSPQEKKKLSYAKDHRNGYRENDKASRKLIPKRKQQASQHVRRSDKANLKRDPEHAAGALPQLLKTRWRKWADTALSEHVTNQQSRRLGRNNRRAK